RREDDLLLFELARERALEDAVHVLDERRARAPGMLEDLVRRAARDERGERVAHELGIAASETVDRLLDVAYEDDPTRERRELHEDRELHRVGVLELVDEQELELVAEPLAHGRQVERGEEHLLHVAEIDQAALGFDPLEAGERGTRDAIRVFDIRADVAMEIGMAIVRFGGSAHFRRYRIA